MAIEYVMLERRGVNRILSELKEQRLVFVGAPAGYGKTVAVSQWLTKDTKPFSLLSLDGFDKDMVAFCERFCACLCALQPQNKALAEIVSHPAFQSSPDAFTLRSITALFRRKKVTLAIDDLHLLHDSEVLQLLLGFIKRMPKNFQIVLISRHDMPQSYHELWVKEQGSTMGKENLLFTIEEIVSLYGKQGVKISQAEGSDIMRKTGGWAMGVNAYLLSGGQTENSVRDYLEDFIEVNIWNRWCGKTQEFMLATAQVCELIPDLCKAITGVFHSDKLLAEFTQKGAFVSKNQSGTYSYHHLFQQFLMKRIAEDKDPDFARLMLEKEGYWHLGQNDFRKAIDCFIRCKSHEGIGKFYIQFATSISKDFALMKLLPALSHPEIVNATAKYPFLLYIAAACASFEGRASDAIFYMDEYYKRHDEIVRDYPALAYEITLMRLWDFRITFSKAMEMMGDLPDLVDTTPVRSVSMHMPFYHRGAIDFSGLKQEDMEEKLNMFFKKMTPNSDELRAMRTEIVTASLLYEQGKLTDAYEHAMKALSEMRNEFSTDSKFCAMSILVCVLDALGGDDAREADELVASTKNMIEAENAYHLARNFNAFKTRRQIAKGDTKAAEQWIFSNQDLVDTTLHGTYADITTCRAYLAAGHYNFAVVLLSTIHKKVSDFGRTPDIIEARILLARAYWKKKKGFQKTALEYLENAILAAQPYGYEQMFVAEKAHIAVMLYRLQKRVEQQEFKGHLDFIKALYAKCADGMDHAAEDEKKVSIKFTDKQKAVMELLCQGKTRGDIAAALGIKIPTLRTHLDAIYGKLEVSDAKEAVKKINSQRILENIGGGGGG